MRVLFIFFCFFYFYFTFYDTLHENDWDLVDFFKRLCNALKLNSLYIDWLDDFLLNVDEHLYLISWQGEEVEEFQPICEVQSDKATIEITSRYKGKVSRLLYVPGDIVKVRFQYLIVMS